MSNIPSQQIKLDLGIEISKDIKLTNNEKEEILINSLGSTNLKKKFVGRKPYYIYTTENGNNIVLLLAQVTYLGNPHSVFKKRIQLKNWFLDVYKEYSLKDNYEIKFIGIYCYKNNVIFVDFDKSNYLNRNLNNSSAHVYINDLYQAMKEGQFRKKDINNNIITTIKYIEFKNYLNGKIIKNSLFDLFEKFNNGLPFGEWLDGFNILKKLCDEKCQNWQQSEWPGWYIEHEFDKFTQNNNVENIMKYIKNKGKNLLDFDIWFNEDSFYGDLKTSDINKSSSPGNDKDSFLKCINKYGKFWYIIYEHHTIKDDIDGEYTVTKQRNNYRYSLGQWPKDKIFNEFSYKDRMKRNIMLKRMYIIELNTINYSQVLSDFNQGKQPTGESRKTKFMISKKNIDNFIIFSYEYPDNEI